MAPSLILRTTKSTLVLFCLANYILLPFSTQLMTDIIAAKWFNLLAYLAIEPLFLATFRRLDFRTLVGISQIATILQIWLQMYSMPWLELARDNFLLLPVVIDAAVNVSILVLAINLSNPANPRSIPFFEIMALVLIAATHVLILRGRAVEYPLEAVLFSGTWEQASVFESFLSLRIGIGALVQPIFVDVSNEWDLRIGVSRFVWSLDLDESDSDLEEQEKPKGRFLGNANLLLIVGGAGCVIAAVLLSVAFGLVKGIIAPVVFVLEYVRRCVTGDWK